MNDPHILHNIALASGDERTMGALRRASKAYHTLLKRHPVMENQLYDTAAEANGPQPFQEAEWTGVAYSAFGKLHRGGDQPAVVDKKKPDSYMARYRHYKQGVAHRDNNRPAAYTAWGGVPRNPIGGSWYEEYRINGEERRTDGGYTDIRYDDMIHETQYRRRENGVLQDHGDRPAMYFTGPTNEPFFQAHFRDDGLHMDHDDRPALLYDATKRSESGRLRTPFYDHAVAMVLNRPYGDVKSGRTRGPQRHTAWHRNDLYDRRNREYPVELTEGVDGTLSARWLGSQNRRVISEAEHAEYQHAPPPSQSTGKRKRND